MAHSPGPWTWNESETGYPILYDGIGNIVLVGVVGVTPTDDDQSLIAAAPKMLELLREASISATFAPGEEWQKEVLAIIAEIEGPKQPAGPLPLIR